MIRVHIQIRYQEITINQKKIIFLRAHTEKRWKAINEGVGWDGILPDPSWWPESIKWFIEDEGFSPSHDSAPPHPFNPLAPLSSASCLSSLHVCCRSSLLTGVGGRGYGRSQILRRRESVILYKSVNTLCSWRKITVSFHFLQKRSRF